ncbi:calcium/sodium antiporter [Parabacteroides pacaensis]|uniref:calcium/sodium antiporter n=1 Tax=Parabacteroides pacaensis TaxID=2086575 RepID=UPI000D102FB6|nr:calcium/sodium antiporter [Parabacteroides pacaensis]
MTTSIFLLILSLIALYIGADWLVRGSSALAARANISPLVIGLTVVAFGTSAPELIVSLNAALHGQGDIAIGNVVGSNIFNICLILGVSAIIHPLQAKTQLVKKDIPIMIVATILFTILFWNGKIGRLEGLLFFTGIVVYTFYSLYFARKHNKESNLSSEEKVKLGSGHWYVDVLFLIGGLAVLVFASQLLVDNAVSLAKSFGVSEAVIGLTIVAAGTSMPELATSIVAAYKKNPEIAVGNIVGSNIFNLLAIVGTTALVHPINAPQVNYIDLLVMLGASILILPIARTGYKINRWEGVGLVIIYVGYTFYLLRDVL